MADLDLQSLGMRLGEAITPTPSNAPQVRYATIATVNPNGTLDVTIDGTTLRGVCATTGCVGAQAGMRCVVLRQGPLATVMGVIASTDLSDLAARDVSASGVISADGNVEMANNAAIYGTDGDGNLRIVLEALDSNGNTSLGYGGYAASMGALNLWGNAVNVKSRGKINLNGQLRSNANNPLLWSGALYMTSDHTANLSENVSDQLTGIVLCWSAYSSGTAQNYSWNYTFIPKSHAVSKGGQGVSCMLIDSDHIGVKYVYVSNGKIVGNDRNDDNGNVSGTNNVKFSNNYWVLRAVYGV